METPNNTNYGLSRSKEELFADDNFINPIPRAVIRPNTPILLDGKWRFSVDREDRGILEGWHLRHEYEATADWPGTIEEHLAEAKGQKDKKTWQDKVVVWYERDFPLPDK